MSPRPLGDRIGSILATSQEYTRPTERLSSLPVSALRSGSQQPRRDFDEEGLQSLAQSIRERGILQPLLVRPLAESGHEIVAGERRWRAAQLAGLTEVPVIIRAIDDQEAAVVAMIENLQRENLNVIDEIDGKILLISRALELPVEQVPARLTQLRHKPSPAEVELLAAVFRPLGETWESFARNKLRVLNYPPVLVEALRRGMAMRMVSLIARAPAAHHERLLTLAEQGMGHKEMQAEVERLVKSPRPARAKRVGQFLSSKEMDRLPAGLREQVEVWLAQMPAGLAERVQDN